MSFENGLKLGATGAGIGWAACGFITPAAPLCAAKGFAVGFVAGLFTDCASSPGSPPATDGSVDTLDADKPDMAHSEPADMSPVDLFTPPDHARPDGPLPDVPGVNRAFLSAPDCDIIDLRVEDSKDCGDGGPDACQKTLWLGCKNGSAHFYNFSPRLSDVLKNVGVLNYSNMYTRPSAGAIKDENGGKLQLQAVQLGNPNGTPWFSISLAKDGEGIGGLALFAANADRTPVSHVANAIVKLQVGLDAYYPERITSALMCGDNYTDICTAAFDKTIGPMIFSAKVLSGLQAGQINTNNGKVSIYQPESLIYLPDDKRNTNQRILMEPLDDRTALVMTSGDLQANISVVMARFDLSSQRFFGLSISLPEAGAISLPHIPLSPYDPSHRWSNRYAVVGFSSGRKGQPCEGKPAIIAYDIYEQIYSACLAVEETPRGIAVLGNKSAWVGFRGGMQMVRFFEKNDWLTADPAESVWLVGDNLGAMAAFTSVTSEEVDYPDVVLVAASSKNDLVRDQVIAANLIIAENPK